MATATLLHPALVDELHDLLLSRGVPIPADSVIDDVLQRGVEDFEVTSGYRYRGLSYDDTHVRAYALDALGFPEDD